MLTSPTSSLSIAARSNLRVERCAMIDAERKRSIKPTYKAKFSLDLASEIHRRSWNGESSRKLASEYGCTHQTIIAVRNLRGPYSVLDDNSLFRSVNRRGRLAAGRCPKCGGRPERGYLHCGRCLDRARAYSARYRRKRERDGNPVTEDPITAGRRRKTRLDAGLCPKCGEQPENGNKYCRRCLARAAEYNRSSRARKAGKIV